MGIRPLGFPSVNFTVVMEKLDGLTPFGGELAELESERLKPRRNAAKTHSEAVASFRHEKPRHADLHAQLQRTGSNRDDSVVFVHNVQLVKHPERLIPTLIRLQPSDKPLCLDGSIFEFS